MQLVVVLVDGGIKVAPELLDSIALPVGERQEMVVYIVHVFDGLV